MKFWFLLFKAVFGRVLGKLSLSIFVAVIYSLCRIKKAICFWWQLWPWICNACFWSWFLLRWFTSTMFHLPDLSKFSNTIYQSVLITAITPWQIMSIKNIRAEYEHRLQTFSQSKSTISNTLSLSANVGFALTTLAAYFGLYGSQKNAAQGFFIGIMLFCCLRLCALSLNHQLLKSTFSTTYASFLIIAILLYCSTLQIHQLLRVGCITTVLSILIINLHSVTIKLHIRAWWYPTSTQSCS